MSTKTFHAEFPSKNIKYNVAYNSVTDLFVSEGFIFVYSKITIFHCLSMCSFSWEVYKVFSKSVFPVMKSYILIYLLKCTIN